MEKHVKVIGWLYIVSGALGVLSAIGVAFAIRFLRTVLGDSAGPEEITHMGVRVLRLVSIFLILIAAPGLIGGIGLLKRQPWARIVVLILGFISLIFFPFGTVVGVYTIWVLMKDETVRLFAPTAEAPAVSGEDGGSVPSRLRDYRLSGLVWIVAGAAFVVCVALSVGLTKGAERALTVGIWGVIPLAVGVAFFLYGTMVRKEQGGRFGILGIVALLIPLMTSPALAYTHEEVFQKTVPAAGISRLSVRNFNGEIRVEPWDRPEIQIEAKKRVNHSSREGAENYARKVEIVVETMGDAVEVKTVTPGQKDEWDWVEGFFSFDWMFEGFAKGVSVSYAISAPRKMDTDLKSTNGAVKVGAMEGRADLRTTNGALKAEGLKGSLTGRTTNGAIALSGMAGACDLVSTNGKITAEFLVLGGGGCELRTTNGGIQVTLPENVRADLEANTTNGSVTSELPLSLQGEISKRRMEGKINGGGPLLKLRTTNGGISIVKGEGRGGQEAFGAAPPLSKENGGTLLRIQVWEKGQKQISISVPLSTAQEILRALPDPARELMGEKGVDVERLIRAVLSHPKPGKLIEVQDEDRRVEIAVE